MSLRQNEPGELQEYCMLAVAPNCDHAPPSQGVSSGPNITARQHIMLLSVGVPLIPGGGSFCRAEWKQQIICHGGNLAQNREAETRAGNELTLAVARNLLS